MQLCTELKAFRSKTCFDQKWVNIFVTPVAGTPTHQLWQGMRKYLLTKGTMMRDGMAPMSNQERTMEKHLEEIKTIKEAMEDQEF